MDQTPTLSKVDPKSPDEGPRSAFAADVGRAPVASHSLIGGAGRGKLALVAGHERSHVAAVVEGLLCHFVGRTDVYARQQSDGTYRSVKRPLTTDLLRRHVEGKLTIGAYQLNASREARAFVIDIDGDGSIGSIKRGREVVHLLWDSAPVPLYPFFSGSKGWHLWGLLTEPVAGARALGAAQAIVAGVGGIAVGDRFRLPGCDLGGDFSPRGLGGSLGGLMKLPLGIHQKTGQRALSLTPDGRLVFDLPEVELISPAALPVPSSSALAAEGDPTDGANDIALVGLWDGDLLPWEDWMSDVVIRARVPVGCRNTVLHQLASWFVTRLGTDSSTTRRLVDEVNARSPHPLGKAELASIVRSAHRNPRQGLGLEILIDAGSIHLANGQIEVLA